MDFSPELIALVTLGLLLNAGTLEEVQQAWGWRMNRLKHGLIAIVAFSGVVIIAEQLRTIDGRFGYMAPALFLGGYGVLWACMQISRSTRVVQLLRQPGSSPGADKSLLPLRLVVSAMVGASAILLTCAVLHEPATPAGEPRDAAAATGPSDETHDQE